MSENGPNMHIGDLFQLLWIGMGIVYLILLVVWFFHLILIYQVLIQLILIYLNSFDNNSSYRNPFNTLDTIFYLLYVLSFDHSNCLFCPILTFNFFTRNPLNSLFAVGCLKNTFSQFHQHFTSSFCADFLSTKKYKHTLWVQKSCAFCTKKLLVKCWWNWR